MKKIIAVCLFALSMIAVNAQKAITPPLTWEITPSGVTWTFDTTGVSMNDVCSGYIQETIAPYSKIASFTCNSVACPAQSGKMYSYFAPLSSVEYVGSCDVHQIYPATGVHNLKCYILMRGELQLRVQNVTINFGATTTVKPISPTKPGKGGK